ncbi:MAG: ATP-dependent DNA ligase [Candidatus Methanogranum gryphiswaldense]|nr:MAG: ATP-dependent DNA ligase [Candidatus Methanogranum sp. U3.2.1]
MLYSELAEQFDILEQTSSRLEMTTQLSLFFRKVDPKEIRIIIYLCQGKLHPDFYGIELGMSDKLVLKAISSTTGTSPEKTEKMWIEQGDSGTVAEGLIGIKKQMTLFSESLTLERVVKNLLAIENADGKDSQTKKTKYLAQLLHDSSPIEARYLCRIVTGRMRVGAGSMTLLDALAEAFATKNDRSDIERGYNITCDLGLVAEKLAIEGLQGIQKMQVTIGNPIKVMLAERLPSITQVIEKMGGKCAMEYKYDGIRVQAHISKDSVKLYSRRLEDLTSNFPDIAEALRNQCKCTETIIEGECVAIDNKTGDMLPFQTVTHRRKKHGMEEAIKEFPVKIFMFDIIYADNADMSMYPYPERRRILSESFDLKEQIDMTTMKVVNSPEEGEEFFNEALAAKCEGIMAKSLSDDSVYRAGSRGFLWIKYKKDYEAALTDSFDLAVVGAFFGMGKRAGKYGALLMASYDDETGRFGTVCKLGTGFDDEFLAKMPELLDGYLSNDKPSSVDAKMIPDVWFDPTVVLEVVAAEISVSPIHTAAEGIFSKDSGLGLRFPRFTGRIRDDKGPEQCTTVHEICEIYELQEKKDTHISE